MLNQSSTTQATTQEGLPVEAEASTSTRALLFEGGDLPCGDLSLTARVEAAILLADRPISEAKLTEVLGFVPMKERDAETEDAAAIAKDSKAVAARRTLKNRTRVQQIGIRNPNAATLATHDAHSKISVPRDRRKEERGIKLHRTNA